MCYCQDSAGQNYGWTLKVNRCKIALRQHCLGMQIGLKCLIESRQKLKKVLIPFVYVICATPFGGPSGREKDGVVRDGGGDR